MSLLLGQCGYIPKLYMVRVDCFAAALSCARQSSSTSLHQTSSACFTVELKSSGNESWRQRKNPTQLALHCCRHPKCTLWRQCVCVPHDQRMAGGWLGGISSAAAASAASSRDARCVSRVAAALEMATACRPASPPCAATAQPNGPNRTAIASLLECTLGGNCHAYGHMLEAQIIHANLFGHLLLRPGRRGIGTWTLSLLILWFSLKMDCRYDFVPCDRSSPSPVSCASCRCSVASTPTCCSPACGAHIAYCIVHKESVQYAHSPRVTAHLFRSPYVTASIKLHMGITLSSLPRRRCSGMVVGHAPPRTLEYHKMSACKACCTVKPYSAHQEGLGLADDIVQALPLAVRPAHETDVAAHALQHAQPHVKLLGRFLQSVRVAGVRVQASVAAVNGRPASNPAEGPGSLPIEHEAQSESDRSNGFTWIGRSR